MYTHLNTHISTHIHIHRTHMFKLLQLLTQRQKEKTKPEEDAETNAVMEIYLGSLRLFSVCDCERICVYRFTLAILFIYPFYFSSGYFSLYIHIPWYPFFLYLPSTWLSSVSFQILLQLPCPHRFLWSRLRHITMV